MHYNMNNICEVLRRENTKIEKCRNGKKIKKNHKVEKYRNREIVEYKNTKIQKYKNSK